MTEYNSHPFTSGNQGQTGSSGGPDFTTDPWAEIDLGAAKDVGSVTIYPLPHESGRAYSFSPFELWISDQPAKLGTTPATSGTRCATVPLSDGDEDLRGKVTALCAGAGRYVSVMMPGTSRILSLMEIMVHPCPPGPSPPPPLPPHYPPGRPHRDPRPRQSHPRPPTVHCTAATANQTWGAMCDARRAKGRSSPRTATNLTRQAASSTTHK